MLTLCKVQSYFQREIFTMCFIIAAFWPLLYGTGFFMQNVLLSAAWAIGCVSMSIFTLLPVVKAESTGTM
jgi:phosphatidylinositol glycan class N